MNTTLFKSLGALAVIGCLLLSSCKPSDTQISKAANAAVTRIAPGVTVAVQNGVATLNGTVADEATKTAVDSVVKNVKGVKSITDNTTATPPPPPTVTPTNSDLILQHRIDSSIHAKNITGVMVSVTGGVVTLTGTAPRKDLQTIMQAANESHPQKVVNQLTIK